MAKYRLTKSEKKRRIEKTVSFFLLLIICIIWAFPLVYMLGTSFRTGDDIALYPSSILPTTWNAWTLDNYTGFIVREGKIDNMPIWMLNSLWSTAASVVLTLVFDLLTAYALVFVDFKGKKAFMSFLLLWYAVPGVIGTASSLLIYYSIRNTLQINNEVALYIYIYMWIIIPGITGIFNLLLMRNFFASIPMEIIESARTDGASDWTIFKRIVLPLAKSTIMLIILFSFTGGWNALQWPQLLLDTEGISYWKTITVALTGYTSGNGWNMKGVSMATSVFALIPIIIVFAITQNKMIDGLASTGVKR